MTDLSHRGNGSKAPAIRVSNTRPRTHNTMFSGIATRRTDEVEKLGKSECKWTTSLQTEYGGEGRAAGTMFTVTTNSTMEVLTLEFDTTSEEDVSVVVYYKKGDFSGVTNDPEKWTLLADAVAQRIPGEAGAIIPANDFSPVSLQSSAIYSFYLNVQSGEDALKMRLSDSLIGETFFTDSLGLLSLQTGVSLDSEFPNAFKEQAQFSGRLHYKTTQPCDSVRTTTVVELEFAVNKDPDEDVMLALSEAVRKSIEAVVILDVDLIQFEKYDDLEIVSSESAFMGIIEGKCPVDFDSCSNIFTRVTFLHLPTITSGEIQMQVFENDSRIADSVITQSDYEVQYVGPPLISVDFLVTLIGVPTGLRMNTLQRRYFETVTEAFLQKNLETPIYTVKAQGDIDATGSEGRRLISSAPSLRGTRNRRIEDAADSLMVVTTIFGASPTPADFREAVLEGLSLVSKDYSLTLASQQLRPGEINEDDSGNMFANVTTATIIIKPADLGTKEVGGDPPVEESLPVLWIALCSVFLVLSIGWLLFRTYKDFCASPPKDDMKASGDDKGQHFLGLQNLSVDDLERGERTYHDSLDLGSSSDCILRSERPRSTPDLARNSDHLPFVRPRSIPNLQLASSSTHNRTFERPRSSPNLMHSHSAHSRSPTPRMPQRNPFVRGDPANDSDSKRRGVKPTKSLPLTVRKPVKEHLNSGASRQSHPCAQDVIKQKTPEKPTARKRASSVDGISNARGRSMGSAPEPKLNSQPSRTSEDRSVNSGGSEGFRSMFAAKNMPPVNPSRKRASSVDGISNNSGHSTRSPPEPKLNGQFSRTSEDRSVNSGRRSPGMFAAKKMAPVSPSRKRASSVDGISNARGRSMGSVPELKLNSQPSRTSEDRSVNSGGSEGVPGRFAAKKVAPVNPSRKRASSVDGISNNSGHSMGSAPELKLKSQFSRTAEDRSVKSGRRAPGMFAAKKMAPVNPPRKRANSVDGVSNNSGHSIRSAPELKLKSQPSRTSEDRSVKSGSAKSTPGTFAAKKKGLVKSSKPLAKKGGSSRDDIGNASGHSVRSAPEMKVTKQPLLAVKRKKQPTRTSHDRAKREMVEEIDSSSSDSSESSEESDIDDDVLVKSVSLERDFETPLKPKSLPAISVTRKDHSESSEESDFEDYVSTLAARTSSNNSSSDPEPVGFSEAKSRADPGAKPTDAQKPLKKTKKVRKLPVSVDASKTDESQKNTPDESRKGLVKTKAKKKKNIKKQEVATKGVEATTIVDKVEWGGTSAPVAKTMASSVEKTPETAKSTTAKSIIVDSRNMTSVRKIVVADSDHSSSSSESDFEGIECIRPIRSFTIRSGRAEDPILDEEDAMSSVSSITASFHSNKLRSNAIKQFDAASPMAETPWKSRNRVANVTEKVNTAFLHSSSPFVSSPDNKVQSSSASQDQLQSNDQPPQGRSQRPTVDDKQAGHPARPLTTGAKIDREESMSKEQKVAEIRAYLKDASVPPRDLNEILMRKLPVEDKVRQPPGPISNQKNVRTTVPPIDHNQIMLRPSHLDDWDSDDANVSMPGQNSLVKMAKKRSSGEQVKSPHPDIPTRLPALNGRIARSSSSEHLNAAASSTLRNASRDAPPRSVRRTISNESLVTVNSSRLPIRGVRSVPSNENPMPGRKTLSTEKLQTAPSPRGVLRTASDDVLVPGDSSRLPAGCVLGISSHEKMESTNTRKTISDERLKKVPSAEALRLREIARGVRRTSSKERFPLLSPTGSINRESARRLIQRSLSEENLLQIHSSAEQRSKKWGDLVRTYSNEKLVSATASNKGLRSELKRSASDERRGAIALHLKDVLGDEGS